MSAILALRTRKTRSRRHRALFTKQTFSVAPRLFFTIFSLRREKQPKGKHRENTTEKKSLHSCSFASFVLFFITKTTFLFLPDSSGNSCHFGSRSWPLSEDSFGIGRHFHFQILSALLQRFLCIATHVATSSALQGAANIWQ
jgi:hypothetical protein